MANVVRVDQRPYWVIVFTWVSGKKHQAVRHWSRVHFAAVEEAHSSAVTQEYDLLILNQLHQHEPLEGSFPWRIDPPMSCSTV